MNQGAAAEALMILGALCTLAGVLTRNLRHRKEPYKGRVMATVVKNEQVALYYKEGEPELFKLADPGPLKKVERLFYSAGAGMCLLGVVSYMGFAARYLK